MARKTTHSETDNTNRPTDRLVDQDDEPIYVEETADGIPVDPFQGLFGPDVEGGKVELYRLHPETWGNLELKGFLRLLTPVDDLTSIASQYGGGLYRLVQRSAAGRIVRHRSITISGPPRTSSNHVAPSDDDRAADGDRVAVKTPLGEMRVPLTGNDEAFLKMVERLAMIRHAFPEREDVNDRLLQIALQKTEPGATLESLLSIAEKIVTMTAGSDKSTTGTTWLDIAREALNGFKEYVHAAGAVRPGAAPLKTGSLPQIPNTAGAAAPQLEHQPGADMNLSLLAEKAASYLVAGYIATPRMQPPETAEIIGAILPPLTDTVRAEIRAKQSTLFLIARAILTNQTDTDETDAETFRLYFQETFNILTTPDETLDQEATT